MFFRGVAGCGQLDVRGSYPHPARSAHARRRAAAAGGHDSAGQVRARKASGGRADQARARETGACEGRAGGYADQARSQACIHSQACACSQARAREETDARESGSAEETGAREGRVCAQAAPEAHIREACAVARPRGRVVWPARALPGCDRGGRGYGAHPVF